jgi:hypothetical protein
MHNFNYARAMESCLYCAECISVFSASLIPIFDWHGIRIIRVCCWFTSGLISDLQRSLWWVLSGAAPIRELAQNFGEFKVTVIKTFIVFLRFLKGTDLAQSTCFCWTLSALYRVFEKKSKPWCIIVTYCPSFCFSGFESLFYARLQVIYSHTDRIVIIIICIITATYMSVWQRIAWRRVRANSRNVLYTKYTSDRGQCAT